MDISSGLEWLLVALVMFALFCAGYLADADQAYRAAKKAGRDTFYEIQADVILHPQYFKGGYPPFQSESNDPLLVPPPCSVSVPLLMVTLPVLLNTS